MYILTGIAVSAMAVSKKLKHLKLAITKKQVSHTR